jgi:hypothetical protein
MGSKPKRRYTRMNLDLTFEQTHMVQVLLEEYGLNYAAELMRVLIKDAYKKAKGPYSLEKS